MGLDNNYRHFISFKFIKITFFLSLIARFIVIRIIHRAFIRFYGKFDRFEKIPFSERVWELYCQPGIRVIVPDVNLFSCFGFREEMAGKFSLKGRNAGVGKRKGSVADFEGG